MMQQPCQADHPALRAWAEIAGTGIGAVEVKVLKHRSASQVCRLNGLGPEGANVIAKRSPKPKALAEYRIYQQVLRKRWSMPRKRRHAWLFCIRRRAEWRKIWHCRTEARSIISIAFGPDAIASGRHSRARG